jgi:hypothetical protein
MCKGRQQIQWRLCISAVSPIPCATSKQTYQRIKLQSEQQIGRRYLLLLISHKYRVLPKLYCVAGRENIIPLIIIKFNTCFVNTVGGY